ncbi:MAG: HNH endonuclease [Anaerolineae bacterium CG_4_9_14_3_um_filter_57_17]|nr:HNH endonuclease [bacterium]NCT19604.1 HNH endonuclease [bacterium]OIO85838.1 MAG: HNH endonuclease [Anaerolineae bacterium CG2_30_57_67]PJB65859.1 MAG: HNH endonuclease [Anaerolineae bacterium CG_4_9_14_3_um_filter_57_17]
MDAPVLVLNANFEPLNICNTRRAIGLMLTGKAALIANGRGTIQTVSQAFPRPSVIRLDGMIQRPRPHIKLSRHEIFRRDGYTCQYCGKQGGNLTIDHILPRHLGGQHTWRNVITACAACNHRKGGRKLEESHMTLLSVAVEPPASAAYLFGLQLRENQEWEPYIRGW